MHYVQAKFINRTRKTTALERLNYGNEDISKYRTKEIKKINQRFLFEIWVAIHSITNRWTNC